MMDRKWLGVAIVSLFAIGASALLARPGVVKTNDGRTLEGDVNDDKPDTISIKMRGGITVVTRDQVASIQFTADLQQEFKRRAAALPPDADVPGHIQLARWLFDNHMYDESEKQLQIALSIDKNNDEARTLLATVRSQIKLGHAPDVPAHTPVTPVRPLTPVSPVAPALPGKYLSAEDINAVKIAEWRRDDTTVRVRFDGDVREKYIRYAGENAAQFHALPAAEQAQSIIERGTPQMRQLVIIGNDPAPLAEYKRAIQPIIVNGCATAACHGGLATRSLLLYPCAGESNAAVLNQAAYTNFFMLAVYTKVIDKVERMMIDRMYPDSSLLLQYALPAELADIKHPPLVKGQPWRGVFKGKDDARYKTISNWMKLDLAKPEPKYDNIKFPLAHRAAPPAPATAPATAPVAPAPTPAVPLPPH